MTERLGIREGCGFPGPGYSEIRLLPPEFFAFFFFSQEHLLPIFFVPLPAREAMVLLRVGNRMYGLGPICRQGWSGCGLGTREPVSFLGFRLPLPVATKCS